MIKLKSLLLVGLSGGFTYSCATTPKVEEVDVTLDPKVEIQNFSNELDSKNTAQYNVLAPESYRKAKAELDDAKSALDKGKGHKEALTHVAQGRAWLKDGEGLATKVGSEFKEVVELRAYAVKVGAPQFAKKEFGRADDSFEKVTADVKKDKVSLEDHKKLQQHYEEAIIVALQDKYLSKAEEDYKLALKEGAGSTLKSTAEQTKTKLREASAFVSANFMKEGDVAQNSKIASTQSERLLRLTREANNNKGKTVEEITLEDEKKQKELADAAAIAAQNDSKINSLSVANVEGQQKLDQVKRVDQVFASARVAYKPSEADILRDGDRMIIRLKGLNFKSGNTDLTAKDIDLLNRASQTIAQYAPASITIEGHTDTTGNTSKNKKISTQRAEVVKKYLEGSLTKDEALNIKAEGMGSEKPVARNDRSKGRAQNRRVDLILSTNVDDSMSPKSY